MTMTASEAAKLAGYLPAKDLGESTRVLDRMCEEHGLQPMVIGSLKFYPEGKLRKHLDQFRDIPDDMVSVAEWCVENGFRRSRVCSAIRSGRYPGTFVYGLREGRKGRPGYYVIAEEVSEFLGVEAPEEIEWLTLEQAAEHSGLSKSKLRKLIERDEISAEYDKDSRQYLVDSGSLDAYTEGQEDEAEAAVQASDAPTPQKPSELLPTDLSTMLKYFEESSKRQSDLHREVIELIRKPSTVTSAINNLTSRLESLEETVKAGIQADARREVSLTEVLKTFIKKMEESSDEIGAVNDTLDDMDKKLGDLDMTQVSRLIGKVGLMIDSFEKFRSAAITKMQHDRAHGIAPAPAQVVGEGDEVARG